MDQQVQKAIDEALTNFTAKYELDTEVVSDLRLMLVTSMKANVKARPAAAASKVDGKRPRRKTGYNLFIRAKFAQAKADRSDEDQKTNSQELMSTYSKEWKELPEDQKQPYIEQANVLNTESGAESSGKKKGGKKNISGYNLFYSEEKDSIRAEKDADVTLMKAVGASWKALEKDAQLDYNKRAAEISSNRE